MRQLTDSVNVFCDLQTFAQIVMHLVAKILRAVPRTLYSSQHLFYYMHHHVCKSLRGDH